MGLHGELHSDHPAGHSLAPHLLVLLLVLPVPLVSSQAIHLSGIAAWKEAIQQHSQAEGRVDTRKGRNLPGLTDREDHQRLVLEAERKLQQSGEDQEGEEKKGKERVNTQKGLTKNKKSALLKLISKLSKKSETTEKTKSKVETLLEEEREQALQSDDEDNIILLRLKNKRRKKQISLKRRPLRRKSHIVVLPGDYLVSGDLLSSYDDYDDYDDYVEEVPLFNDRVRSGLTGRLSSAEKTRKNIKRKIRKLLRSSS